MRRAAMKRLCLFLLGFFICSGAAAHSTEIDVVWIKGQSNAAPNSESLATSPTVPAGKVLKYQDNALSDANDPVGAGRGIGGSAWPSFGKTYYELTGRQICFVPTAVHSSAMVPAADIGTGDWSETGTLNTAGLAAYRSAIKALTDKGYTIGKQFIIDVQGETDGFKIDAGTITAGQFMAAKKAMIARDRANLGIPDLPFYFSLLGATESPEPDPGWIAVQQAQKAICSADPYTKIAFWKADSFPSRGMQQYDGGLHYTQAGYNEMGAEMARNIVAGTFLPCGASPFGSQKNE